MRLLLLSLPRSRPVEMDEESPAMRPSRDQRNDPGLRRSTRGAACLERLAVRRANLLTSPSNLLFARLAGRLRVHCRFVDYVPGDELPARYESARAAVVASRYDNFPFAALEAMASARPVVCTRATGTAELTEGTDAGFAEWAPRRRRGGAATNA